VIDAPKAKRSGNARSVTRLCSRQQGAGRVNRDATKVCMSAGASILTAWPQAICRPLCSSFALSAWRWSTSYSARHDNHTASAG